MKKIQLDLQLKSLEEAEEGLYIEGYATTFGNRDRDNEIHMADIAALRKAMDAYMESNPIVLIDHGKHPVIGNTPFGKIINYTIDEIGIRVKAFIEKPVWEPVLEFYNKVKKGILRTFSISAYFEKFKDGVIKARDIVETTVTATPANPKAVFDVVMKAFEEKSVIPFKSYGIADEDTAWDAGQEVKEADIEDLKRISAWYDKENPDVKSSYKLPHHRASDYKAVLKGVYAAYAALEGARGGVDIPEGDKKAVNEHLMGHYKEFGKELPKNFDQTGNGEITGKAGREISGMNLLMMQDVVDQIDEVIVKLRGFVAKIKQKYGG